MSQSETLTPKLTAWDRRVLGALGECPSLYDRASWDQPLEWKDLWQIARKLRCYDLTDLERTLDGLVHFYHAWTRGWGHRRVWIAAPPDGTRGHSA